MKRIFITLNDRICTANYEFTEAEEADIDYPGTQPIIRLWAVFDSNQVNITDTLTKEEWFDIEDQIYINEEL